MPIRSFSSPQPTGLRRHGAALWILCGLAAPAFGANDDALLAQRNDAPAMNTSPVAADQNFDFDIPSQPLASALNRYAFLTKRPAMYPSDMSDGRMSSAVQGRYTPEAALQRLLAGTGLAAEKVHTGAGDTFVLIEAGMPPATAAQAARAGMAALLGERAGYSGLIQRRIWQALCADAGAVPGDYSSLLRFRIDGEGGVRDARLLDSSGNARRDAALLAAVRGVRLDAPPPAALAEQALTMAILPGPSCPVAGEGG